MKAVNFYTSSAWKYFSRYVLLSYSKDNQTVDCITCGKNIPLASSKSCCGHLIKVYDGNSTNFATALLITNTAPQCNFCNNDLHGNEKIMKEKLIETYGQESIDELYIIKRQSVQMSKVILKILTPTYKNMFDDLVKQRGINPWK